MALPLPLAPLARLFGWQRFLLVPALFPFAAFAYARAHDKLAARNGGQLPGGLDVLPPRLTRRHAKHLLVTSPPELAYDAVRAAMELKNSVSAARSR